jgi:proteasome beta subunit
MTLIVALNCRDCVVVASETQSTVPASGTPVRETVAKIRQLNDTTLWAGAGAVSTIQQIERGIESFPAEVRRVGVFDLMPHVTQLVFEIRKEALDRYRALYGVERGEQKAPTASIIVAGYSAGKPTINQVYPDGDFEECEPEVGYLALGIGDIFAHSVLHGRRIQDLTPEQATVLAYKVIREAIDVGAYGLGEPIDIWTLRLSGSSCAIEHLSPERLQVVGDAHLALKQAEDDLLRPSPLAPPRTAQESQSTSGDAPTSSNLTTPATRQTN